MYKTKISFHSTLRYVKRKKSICTWISIQSVQSNFQSIWRKHKCSIERWPSLLPQPIWKMNFSSEKRKEKSDPYLDAQWNGNSSKIKYSTRSLCRKSGYIYNINLHEMLFTWFEASPLVDLRVESRFDQFSTLHF